MDWTRLISKVQRDQDLREVGDQGDPFFDGEEGRPRAAMVAMVSWYGAAELLAAFDVDSR